MLARCGLAMLHATPCSCSGLYHLTEREDRIRALRESRHVLKSGGYAFAATITRVASFIDALCHDLLALLSFR
jgi:hypothetical protein